MLLQTSSAKAGIEQALPGLKLPQEVREFLFGLLSDCNRKIALQLSTFPNAHEEALDLLFVAQFASMQGAIKFGTHWTLRIDAHYIGGGRHYRTWEVADLGLMIFFRRNGQPVGSKVIFLQSKKLYASPLKLKEYDPYHRMGMGRLLVTPEEHHEAVTPKVLRYSEQSKYKALKAQSDQQHAMGQFSHIHKVRLHYLLYNPFVIPWSIQTPVEQLPTVGENAVGCRVIPKEQVDKALRDKAQAFAPSYRQITQAFGDDFPDYVGEAGWRMEHFVCDLVVNGSEGLLDTSPSFESVARLLSQKSSPIASALSITFDYND